MGLGRLVWVSSLCPLSPRVKAWTYLCAGENVTCGDMDLYVNDKISSGSLQMDLLWIVKRETTNAVNDNLEYMLGRELKLACDK